MMDRYLSSHLEADRGLLFMEGFKLDLEFDISSSYRG